MLKRRYLALVSDASQTCGVEEFARQTVLRLAERADQHVLDDEIRRLTSSLADVDAVIVNFPVVAWKKKLTQPIAAALTTRLHRKQLVVVLHEWDALDWKRRLVLAPVVMLATQILFSAPEVAAEFARSPLSALSTSRRGVIPIPPNLALPTVLHDGLVARTLEEQRKAGRLILGQFGSIYPKKQSTAVLEIAARLLALGHDVGVVFVGSFIRGTDNVERDFYALADKLGISGRVTVTGYVANAEELFGIFKHVDVFCYLFSEGLTARRASVLAASFSGKPLVVNAPRQPDAVAHHGLFRKLIDGGAIRLVDTQADANAMAAAALEASQSPVVSIDAKAEVDALWNAVIDALDGEKVMHLCGPGAATDAGNGNNGAR
ncbi:MULTISPECIES: glycosyltransferase [Rhizobium]|uniref:Glycosyltransferase n=1 Tax=Rhizobium favelukesii TaxID=348824 RepID=W6RRN5_9HYPH|nr:MULTISPECIES: glycosyltransferase [Rhizobium]MCA0805394.1 glycosyltransferase [Rhizobium sp. T1473]MCS0461832.1 glycosyltransferase [Rhizobium favelukesii]UFS79275.1 glycosyltransferase [Rhizobium sp. T136]CDM62805.1 glycosyltransferase [Rhizobium favelukesii]